MAFYSQHTGAQVDEAVDKALSADAVPTPGSTNLVESGGVYAATGGFVPTIHTGTAPAAGSAYRETVFSSNKEAYLVECQYLNTNGSWYGLDNETCSLLPKLQDGSICELRFRLASGENAAAGRPIRALILAR